MKTRILLLTSTLTLLIGSIITFSLSAADDAIAPSNQIIAVSSPELNDAATRWAEAFRKDHPDAEIEIKKTLITNTGNLRPDDLVFLTEKELAGDKTSWRITIGRDIVVPVVHSGNPYLSLLAGTGISRDMLLKIISNPDGLLWSNLIPGAKNQPLHVYFSDNEIVAQNLGDYLGIHLPSFGVSEENGIIAALGKDPLAIGFCRLSSVLTPGTNDLEPNIRFLPIDRNGNGQLDYIENIYEDAASLIRGVWIGKYPRELSRDICVASGAQPQDPARVAFLQWLLTEGQQSLAGEGFTGLAYSEVKSRLAAFNENEMVTPVQEEPYSMAKIILFVVVLALVLGIMISGIIGLTRKKEKEYTSEPSAISHNGFDNHTVDIPKGLLYDRTHTWALMEKDGLVKIGMDDFLQHVTGMITRLEMKRAGEKVKKGEKLVSLIQKGKQLTLYAPVSGIIEEVNINLINDPSLLNSSPYDAGWIYKIEPSNWLHEISLLSMAGKYIKWLGDEMVRLKDFLAFPSQPQQLSYMNILQDGGLLKEHVLENMDPEIWEEFQSRFLDVNR